MDSAQLNRRKDTLIAAIMNRWPEVPYRITEEAGDAAIAALEAGKPLRDCIEIAKRKVDTSTGHAKAA